MSSLRVVLVCALAAVSACSSSETTEAPVEDTGASAADSTVDATDETSVDSAVADSAVADTGSADTAVADTAVADSGSADTAVADSGSADTAVADSGSADTGVADTGVADTGVADTGVADTGSADTRTDSASDSGTSSVLPGAACTGSLTDAGLLSLYTSKVKSGTPTYISGGSTEARRLGRYTSALYLRKCDSTAGCGAWEATTQPAYETFYSINTTVRQGNVYLWNVSGTNRLALVSDTVGTSAPGDCLGWTEGKGPIVRTGVSATATLATSVEDNCTAGADPVFYFQEIDLYDPTGIVTDTCMKLTYSKQRNRVDIAPGVYAYDEYMVVYDATY